MSSVFENKSAFPRVSLFFPKKDFAKRQLYAEMYVLQIVFPIIFPIFAPVLHINVSDHNRTKPNKIIYKP